MATQQSSLTKEKAEDLIRGFSTCPYGVLGQQLTASKRFIDVAPFPASIPGLVFVDPAGLHHIQGAYKDGVWVDGGPRNAHGAAGAIYKAIGISDDPLFPQEVRTAIKKTGDAKYHKYIKKSQDDEEPTDVLVIHCVGPDLRKDYPETNKPYEYHEAVDALSNAYYNILSEFLKSGMPALRLLPVSGGIFSGIFGPLLPKITWDSITKSLMKLSLVQVLELKRRDIEFCLFMEKELVDFCSAGFEYKIKEAVDFVRGIPLKPYGVLGQQLLKNNEIIDVAAFPAAIPGLVFVDPAGLHHIKPPGGPQNAQGAAGAIYRAIGISDDTAFPVDVINMVHKSGDAAFHKYINTKEENQPEFLVLHSIGPDFRKNYPKNKDEIEADQSGSKSETDLKYTRSQAVEALGRSYGNILSEFVRSGQPALRLLPLSGGIHAGSFLPQMATLTWEALQIGFWYLGAGEREAVCARNIDLCVFAEVDLSSFERVGFDQNASNYASLMYQGYAEKAAAAAKSALSVAAAGGGTSLGGAESISRGKNPKPINVKSSSKSSVGFSEGGPVLVDEKTSSSNPSSPMKGGGGSSRRSTYRKSQSMEEDYAEYYFGPISKHMSMFVSAVATVSGALGLKKKHHEQGVDPTEISANTDWDVEDEDGDWNHAGPVTESMFAFGIKPTASKSEDEVIQPGGGGGGI
mmetsp:Transcript_28309/g.36613  ORF Transcript_28309/g.36613 Transcript_28309/m.36613 type:complete len:687 (-) Transcript_28309:193-2253(-)